MSYTIARIDPADRRGLEQVDALLRQEGIRRDANLDYICGMMDENYDIIATGSCFGNTLRCFAVDRRHQGEGLLNEVVTHLMQVQAERGNLRLFLYTKPPAAMFFGDLGFYEIARAAGTLVFMENRRDGFPSYLKALERTKREGVSAAVVMNANPFTLGHRYLAETAAAACDTLHLFVVSEDLSLVPADVRKRLVREGTADLANVVVHDCGPYVISAATFPSYFLKDEAAVIEGQARLDLAVFARIAAALNITLRFVGEEPVSLVTGIYNRIMAQELPAAGIACRVVPRMEIGGRPVSASDARKALQEGDMERFRSLVPETTRAWFDSSEAAPVLARIRRAGDVAHYGRIARTPVPSSFADWGRNA